MFPQIQPAGIQEAALVKMQPGSSIAHMLLVCRHVVGLCGLAPRFPKSAEARQLRAMSNSLQEAPEWARWSIESDTQAAVDTPGFWRCQKHENLMRKAASAV